MGFPSKHFLTHPMRDFAGKSLDPMIQFFPHPFLMGLWWKIVNQRVKTAQEFFPLINYWNHQRGHISGAIMSHTQSEAALQKNFCWHQLNDPLKSKVAWIQSGSEATYFGGSRQNQWVHRKSGFDPLKLMISLPFDLISMSLIGFQFPHMVQHWNWSQFMLNI